jgi:hypothetical protein
MTNTKMETILFVIFIGKIERIGNKITSSTSKIIKIIAIKKN